MTRAGRGSRRRPRWAVAGAVGIGAAVIAASEVIDQLASRSLVTPTSSEASGGGAADGSRTLIVLGYGQSGTRAGLINRFRVRQALRTAYVWEADGTGPCTLLMSGGAVRGHIPEAHLLRDEAMRCGFTGEIQLDALARSTEENVLNTLAAVESSRDAAYISHPLHSLLARRYLRHLRPELLRRIRRADDVRILEWGPLRPIMTVIGLRELRRVRRLHAGA
ncbi:ElyC/SanA/YdcF family protein [Helcobacillus massiliensis]